MSRYTGSYIPPRLEEDGVSPADASEDAKAPLLHKEDGPPAATPLGPVMGTIPNFAHGTPVRSGDVPLHDLPNAAAAWNNEQILMTIWMLLSCLQFITSIAAPWTLVPAICGMLGAGLFVCACCNLELPRQVSSCMAMGFVGGGLDMFALFLNVLLLFNPWFHCKKPIEYVDDEGRFRERTVAQCKTDFVVMFILTLLLASHAWVSFRVAIIAERVRNMFNPVSSGIINLA